MSMNAIENLDISNIFLSDIKEGFLPTNYENISNELLSESKEETPLKQSIKFISTKQGSQSVSLLQKKISLKPNDSISESENSNNGRWTKEEQRRFAEAVLKFGNDWKNIQNYVSSRNITQVRSHAQKFLMKLKESNYLKDKGLEQNLSWTKVMNFLNSTLTYDELKEVLFSVDQVGLKKIGKKNLKKSQKKQKQNKKSILENNGLNLEETNSRLNNDLNGEYKNEHYFYKYSSVEKNYFNLDDEKENYNIRHKIISQEEEDKEILQKFIECFNSPSGEITLNSSFDESSNKEEENDGAFFLNEIPIKYNSTFL